MKILMLGWELPPHNSGGLGVACYQLCQHLARQGVDIDFVVPYEEAHEEITFMRVLPATRQSAATLRIVTSGAYDSASFSDDEGAAELRGGGLRVQQKRYTEFVKRLVQEERYDVVHAHDWLTYEAAVAAKEHGRAPVIAHVHATEFDRAGGSSGNPLVHEIEYMGLILADHIVAVSQATKDILVRKYDLPADKIEVVHNSIDTEDLTVLPQDNVYRYLTHLKEQDYSVVISVGRLTVQKGYQYLLEAMQLVVERNPKVVLVLAGAGELYFELIEKAAELGVAGNIMFTGFVRGVELRDVYAIGDMFVMSSVSEPFGLVALEAAGTGNAVLISKQSGVGEVLNNVMRFDYWDTHRLASQILTLSESPAMLGELTFNMEREFAGLSWRTAAEACVRLYGRANGGMEVAI